MADLRGEANMMILRSMFTTMVGISHSGVPVLAGAAGDGMLAGEVFMIPFGMVDGAGMPDLVLVGAGIEAGAGTVAGAGMVFTVLASGMDGMVDFGAPPIIAHITIDTIERMHTTETIREVTGRVM